MNINKKPLISSKNIKLLTVLILAFHAGHSQKQVVSFEVYADGLYLHRPIPMLLTEIANDVFFVAASSSGPSLTSANSLVESFRAQKPESKRRLFNNDNRILVVLKYSDGSPGFISGNRFNYILFDEKVYKDSNHSFLVFVNAYFDIPSVRTFLEEEGLIKR